MANIKVSEMTEATSFDDGDYTMIVQANQNKKISKENIFSNLENEINTNASDISTINTNIGDLTNLKTVDTTNIVNSINSLTGTILWTNLSPNNPISSATTITLSSSDYDMLEVFYLQATSSSGGTLYSSRFLKGYSTRMRIHTTDGVNVYRTLTYSSDTSYIIQTTTADSSVSSPQILAIPLYIVGYKTGLFNNEGE